MFLTNFGTQTTTADYINQRNGNTQMVEHQPGVHIKASIVSNGSSCNFKFFSRVGTTTTDIVTRNVGLAGLGTIDPAYGLQQTIISLIDTDKYVLLAENGFWIFTVDSSYNVTIVDSNKTPITASITGQAHILPLGGNNYVILGINNVIQKFSISTSGSLSLIGSEVTLSGATNTFRLCHLTGGKYFLGNTTHYMILNSTFGTIVGETSFGFTTAGDFYNNYKNGLGSDYIIFVDSSKQIHSIYVETDNSLTISGGVTMAGINFFAFFSDTSGFGGGVHAQNGNLFAWDYCYYDVAPFDIGIGTCILGGYVIQEYAGYYVGYVYEINAKTSEILATSTDNIFMLVSANKYAPINVGNGYAPVAEVILATQTSVDSFNRLTVTYSGSTPTDTTIEVYYTLDNGVTWIQFTAASGTEITVSSSYSLGLKGKMLTSNTSNRAQIDLIYASVRTV